MTPFMSAIKDYYIANTRARDRQRHPGFGVNFNVWFNTVIRGDIATITIEPRVNIQDGSIIHTDSDAPMTIAEGVVIGHGAILHGTHVGKDTLVGMRATLLSGCEVGPECLIAAGTLITEGRRIPPRSVVMGVPGKVVRVITDEELERTRTICAHYLEQPSAMSAAVTLRPGRRDNRG